RFRRGGTRRVAEAAPRPDHRQGRRRRRDPAAGRLGGGDRADRPGRTVHVRDRLLLDAAPLLGAGDPDQGGLRPGRRADAAGGARRPRDGAPDPALHGAAGGALGAAVPVADVRRRLPGVRGCAGRLVPGAGGTAGARYQPRQRPRRVPLFARLPGADVRRHRYRPDPSLDHTGPPTMLDKKTAHSNLTLGLTLALCVALLFAATIVIGLIVSYA